MEISVAELPGDDWDAFVASRRGASLYLRCGWSLLARDVFRHRPYFLHARDGEGRLRGVLPLVQQRGLLGNFLTSVPFFNYGGALAEDEATAIALMNRARELAGDRKCDYLELRDVAERPVDWPVRTDKASMILDLPDSTEKLSRQLGSKLRSQVKRADREAVRVVRGGKELLADFYDVFARNMRDLGTPVYPVRFFRAILESGLAHFQIVVIYWRNRPAAGGFLVIDGKGAEIPWAACRADAKPLGMNMKLYWELLSAVIEQGCETFDFGRSTVGGGTYKFKQQWGARPQQLHWYRWERSPAQTGDSERGQGALLGLALRTWKRLPLPVANTLGPLVSPGLPW